jgi:Fe-S-cluster containining protein
VARINDNMELEQILHNNFNEKELFDMYKHIIQTEPLKLKILKKIKCKKCGWCCKNQSAMLTQEDIKRLMVHFKYSYEEFYEKYLNKELKIPYLKSPCPFLGEENRCNIYNVKPKVCKIYPFVDFFLVVKPCLLGENIYDIMVKSRDFIQNNTSQKDDSHFQQLYSDRIDMLNNITGMEPSKGAEYHSIYIDKDILMKLIKIIKTVKK